MCILQTKWYCLECPFIGRDKAHELLSILVCNLQTKYQCLECPFIGRDKGNTKQHIIAKHMPRKEITCPSCQKSFKNFRAHLHQYPVCKDNLSLIRGVSK